MLFFFFLIEEPEEPLTSMSIVNFMFEIYFHGGRAFSESFKLKPYDRMQGEIFISYDRS